MMCFLINILVVSLLGLVVLCNGQITQSGQCSGLNPTLQSNFDITRFLGTWNEYAISNHPRAGDCSKTVFARATATSAITVTHSTIVDNFLNEYSGSATLGTNAADMTLTIPSVSSSPINFRVIATDYADYAVAYSCQNVGTTERRIYVWQLTKQEQPSQSAIQQMNTALNSLGVNSVQLRVISRTAQACEVLPVIAQGQPIVVPGQCNENIPVVQNFNVTAFLGVWHQQKSYYSENARGTCNRASYGTTDGIVINVANSEIIDEKLRTVTGTATVSSTDGSGRLLVTLQVSAPEPTPLLVLGTDYSQWAISYTCKNLINNEKRLYSWVLSRTRVLPASAQQEVNTLINSIVELNNAYYRDTDQTNEGCFYVPDPVANVPPVFGGQCNQNINVEPNFDASRYLQLWHTIESYPSQYQGGTCSNAYYTLKDDGSINVYNTQVIDQKLDEITGNATIAGNAKLVVTFPIKGTDQIITTDYWVISTDHTSYSLVYSCTNINEYQQQITMWKLSRTKGPLSQQAVQAINTALAREKVFDQNFFVPMSQTKEACFYYPEPNGERVRFPGQCSDETIIPIQNFNLNSFARDWYEVEAYPKDFQPGQCVKHTFTVNNNNNGFNLVSTSVVDKQLLVTNSQVSATTGGSLTITIQTANGPQTIPYYVIATDYNNYALTYSCVDIDQDFKAIYSWKLSRNQQLSSNSIIQINGAMENYRVLSQDYFEPMDQTENGCFYIPSDLAPGDPVILDGQCTSESNLPIKENFDAAAYLDKWRLIESYPSQFQTGRCNRAEYSLNADGTVRVRNSQVIDQTLREAIGSGQLVTNANNQTIGKLIVRFPSSTDPFDLYILDTDYENYSLVYGCSNLADNKRRILSWKLSRSKTLSAQSVAAIQAVTNKVNELEDRFYVKVDHSDQACFYFPDLVPGEHVKFPGQCDESIEVVRNFNAAAYAGTWYEIEAYPAPFQNGTCGTANYVLDANTGVVDVTNTQVINFDGSGPVLDVQEGFAVLATTDGTAKLNVRFNVNGIEVTASYWVLATDYTNYALVYSCRNVDEDYRQVSSWKLSRTRSLSTTANNAIDPIINRIQVLDERYYVDGGQSEDDCFYYPEIGGEDVIMPGNCPADNQIATITNFDINRYVGWWHEMERYPVSADVGECTSSLYQTSTSGFLVTDTAVNNGQATVSDGTVQASANGRLRRTINGRTQDIWVLSTDYETYSLLYSCENVGDQRRVWSAKHSKTKELTAAANRTMAPIIESTQGLNTKYYMPVDQSDEVCFHYPEPTGQQVILPGQCDENIPVVEQFNVEAYGGTWYQIERYPQIHEVASGTCVGARYTLQENGTVTVLNWEVVDGELETIEGTATLIGNNNQAKLNVVLPVRNSTTAATVETSLYVLATDYESYSLAYSCSNVNSFQRSIGAWKLSRARTLAAAGQTAINNVISARPELNQKYFVTVVHNENCLEPSSAALVKSSLFVLLVCALWQMLA